MEWRVGVGVGGAVGRTIQSERKAVGGRHLEPSLVADREDLGNIITALIIKLAMCSFLS